MNTGQRLIIWQLLRDKPTSEAVARLIGQEIGSEELRKYCDDRGFTFDEAQEAVLALFFSVRPQE